MHILCAQVAFGDEYKKNDMQNQVIIVYAFE